MTDFLWPPNWGASVVERIEWLTDVQQSSNGTEVRRSLRTHPRSSLTYEVIVEDVEAVRLKNFIQSNQGKIVGVPWWIGGIEYDVTAFAMTNIPTKLGIDSTYQLGFGPSGSRVLITKNGQSWVRNLAVSNGSNLGISSANWPLIGADRPGAILYPMIDCYLSSTQQLDAPTSNVVRFQITFETVNPIQYGTTTLPTLHNSLPVFTTEPNRREDVSLEYHRLVSELDFQVGKRSRTDRSGQSFRLVSHEYDHEGISEIVHAKSFLNTLKGRHGELYLPSFECDFPELQITAVLLQPVQLNYTDVGYRFLPARPEAFWLNYSTQNYCRDVTSITSLSGGRERMTGSTMAVGVGATLEGAMLLYRSRLATDSVEFVWHSSRVATVSIPFQSLRRT